MNNQTEILRSLGKAMGRMGLYSPAHPAVKESVEEFHDALGAFYAEGNAELILATAEHGLLFNGSLVEEGGAAMVRDLLEKLSLESLTFQKGATVDEILALNVLLIAGPEEIKAGVGKIFEARGITHIRANEAHYIKEDEVGIDLGVQSDQEIAEAIIAEIRGHSLDHMIMAMIKRMVKDEEAQRRIFEMIMEQVRSELEEKIKKATESIEKEKKVIENEKERTETVISSMSDGLVMVDSEGRVIMMNPAAEKLYGRSLKDIAGKRLNESIGSDQMLSLSKDLTTGKAEGMVKEIELNSSEDIKKTLRSSSAVVQNQDGKIVGMMAVLSDVTKQKELEKQKSDFVANVTHELRTPLVAMMQAVTLILDKVPGEINEQQENMLGVAKRNMERLYGLVNDILDMSKIESGKMTIRPDVVETDKLLKEIIQTMRPWADSKEIELSVKMPSHVPKLYVAHDRVMQVFINLINNAIKFTDKGGKVTVEVTGVKKGSVGAGLKPAPTNPAPNLLQISVSDTGKGISREDIPKIFNKFEQLGVRSPADIRGTGLGLSIVKALVELHGGDIAVASEPGKGSIFAVALPIHKEEKGKVEVKTRKEEKKKGIWERIFAGSREVSHA